MAASFQIIPSKRYQGKESMPLTGCVQVNIFENRRVNGVDICPHRAPKLWSSNGWSLKGVIIGGQAVLRLIRDIYKAFAGGKPS